MRCICFAAFLRFFLSPGERTWGQLKTMRCVSYSSRVVLLAWPSSNLDEMVEVPVFEPCRKPVNEDSWDVEEIMVLVAVSWDVALRVINEEEAAPPIA